MNLTKISIKNYRNIDNFEIDLLSDNKNASDEIKTKLFKSVLKDSKILPGYIAIMGRNGIGKSNILSAIMMSGDLVSGEYQVKADEITLSTVVRKILASEMSIDGMSQDTISVEKIKADDQFRKMSNDLYKSYMVDKFQKNANDKTRPIFIKLSFLASKEEEVTTSIAYFNDILNIEFSDASMENKIKQYFERISFSEAFAFLENSKNKKPLSHPVVQILKKLENSLGKDFALKIVQLADPLVEAISLYEGKNSDDVMCDIMRGGKKLTFERLSAGTKQFVLVAAMIVEASKKKNSLLLIDEIELFLHLELINTLKVMMLRAFEVSNTQFIFTTHSPLAISNFISHKQIFGIDEDWDNADHLKVTKLSDIGGTGDSVVKKYERGEFATYPDGDYARNMAIEVIEGANE